MKKMEDELMLLQPITWNTLKNLTPNLVEKLRRLRGFTSRSWKIILKFGSKNFSCFSSPKKKKSDQGGSLFSFLSSAFGDGLWTKVWTKWSNFHTHHLFMVNWFSLTLQFNPPKREYLPTIPCKVAGQGRLAWWASIVNGQHFLLLSLFSKNPKIYLINFLMRCPLIKLHLACLPKYSLISY